MKFVRSFLSFFCTITTAIVFVININYITADDPFIPKYIMFHVMLAGFITALATTVFFAVAEKLGKHIILGTIIHYIIMCVIMIVFGKLFGWVDFDLDGILTMVLSVTIVYAIVFVVTYILMKKEADELNKALKERNKNNIE